MPLEVDAWKKDLTCHPKPTTLCMESGYTFQIGFNHTCSLLRGNMLSTIENPDIVDDYMQKELSESNIAKVVNPSRLLGLQVSPFGI